MQDVVFVQWDGKPSTALFARTLFSPAVETGEYQSLPPQPYMRYRTGAGVVEVPKGHYVVRSPDGTMSVLSPAAFALAYAGDEPGEERNADAWDAHGTSVDEGLEEAAHARMAAQSDRRGW